jgi:hypothetical protein
MRTSVNDLSTNAAQDTSSTTSSDRIVPQLLFDIAAEGSPRVTPTATDKRAHAAEVMVLYHKPGHVGLRCACVHVTQHNRFLLLGLGAAGAEHKQHTSDKTTGSCADAILAE